MGRTTTEDERVIDVLDDLMTFAYAYEGELATNGHLGRLQALADEVYWELAHKLYAFLGTPEKERAIISVMNGLQAAVRMGTPPEEVDFGLAWANKPPVLTGAFLLKVHLEQDSDILKFVAAVIGRLDTAFPPEAKQFITREQVTATVRAMLRTVPESFTVPIHVDTLAGLLHQGFLTALEAREPPNVSAPRWQALMRKYKQQAADKLVEMDQAAFLTRIVRELFSRAQKLHISIDRYYSWGALWKRPLQGKDWLDLYTRLNLSGAVADGKFSPRIAESSKAGVPAAEFINWGARRSPRPIERNGAKPPQTCFNTDDVSIRINGKAIQKRAVMAIRYDKPLGDVEKSLRRFGTYLLAQRKRHCANGQEPLSGDEGAMAQHMAVDALTRRKAARAVLHDKSSVLGHICAVIFLQMQRDRQYPGKSKKDQMLTILELVRQAGFTYGLESIRKACSKCDQEIAAIRLHLAKE